MRSFLTLLIGLSLLGGGASIVAFSVRDGRVRWDMVLGLFVVVFINIICAKYLYAKAKAYRFEWGLFGFLGNFIAVLSFWCVDNVQRRWGRGKSYFG